MATKNTFNGYGELFLCAMENMFVMVKKLIIGISFPMDNNYNASYINIMTYL